MRKHSIQALLIAAEVDNTVIVCEHALLGFFKFLNVWSHRANYFSVAVDVGGEHALHVIEACKMIVE